MENENKVKKWEKPELIIIAKTWASETVLHSSGGGGDEDPPPWKTNG